MIKQTAYAIELEKGDDIRNYVYFCLSEDGYFCKKKPLNQREKQDMYKTYPFVIQVGFRGKDAIIIELKDGSIRDIKPNSIRIGVKPQFLTSKGIKTIYLEPIKAKGETNG